MAHVIIWNSMPGRPVRPLGAHQLASWLRQNGYVVKVIDYCNHMSTADLVSLTETHIEKDTLTIGVSSTFWINDNWPPREGHQLQIPNWVSTARDTLQSRHPHVKWSLGGAKAYQFDLPDWHRFTGVAEDSFLAWLDHLGSKTKIRRRFDILDCTRLYVDDDHIRPSEVIPIELGRGCMFRCKFCAYDNIGKTKGTYLRRHELVAQEIMEHHSRWGTTRFYYVDDTVNENIQKVKDLADIAAAVPFKLEWIGYVRADLMDAVDGMEELVLQSGLRSAFFGIESFERQSSSLVGKGWSGRHAKDWLLERRHRWGNKLTWQLGMVVGIPGQTVDQLIADTEWLIQNDMHNWKYFPLWLEPGSYQSEFSLRSSDYGFTFPFSARPWHWQHESWDFQLAYDTYMELEKLGNKKMRLGAWSLGEVASLGYGIDDIISQYSHRLDHDEINLRMQATVSSYLASNGVSKYLE